MMAPNFKHKGSFAHSAFQSVVKGGLPPFFMKHIANRTLISWWVFAGLIFLLTGCPTSSEWDRQWEQINVALSHGQFQEAKDRLHRLLPSVREQGPTDERYALVIFQLGEVARLEGQASQAEAYYWEALPLLAQSLGSEHPRMADPLAALASLYQQKNQLEMARPLLKRALAIREKFWGFSDPQLLSTLQTYHALLLAGDRPEEAMEIAGRIDRILKRSS